MAGAHSATATATASTSFPRLLANAAPMVRKPPALIYSISTPFRSRLTKRKNYLRPKLLKTLGKPYLNPTLSESPSTSPIIPIESPLEQQPEFQFSGGELKDSEVHEFSLSEASSTVGLVDGIVGNFSTRSVLKIGLYLVGAFVFQTICAVWVLGSANSDYKYGNLGSDDKARVLELDGNGNNKSNSKFLLNGNGNTLEIKQRGMLFVDESEMDKKIVEIQEMAREARQREKLKATGNGLEGDDFIVKTSIEEEVDNRLIKLRKSLQNSYEKLAGSFSRKDGKVGDGIDKEGLAAKEAIVALMFKKKYMFKSPSIDSSNKPKGFHLMQDHSVMRKKMNESLRNRSTDDNEVGSLDKDEQVDLPSGDVSGNISLPVEEDKTRKTQSEDTNHIRESRQKLVKKRAKAKLGVAKTERRFGIPQETRYGKPTVRAAKSGKSCKPETHNSQGSMKENQDATAMSNKRDDLNRNGSLKGRKVGSKKSANKLWEKKSYSETDFWWLSLPYVLAILMRRSGDGEEPAGLFTLRSTSYNTVDSPHTVAFEDRGDATNFCYLLESFFEDLGDFSADVVPIPINELEELVRSETMKVLVVKKQQLQLYAGQPLTDVEMALRSLVGQSDVRAS